jgi:hypothetical protein
MEPGEVANEHKTRMEMKGRKRKRETEEAVRGSTGESGYRIREEEASTSPQKTMIEATRPQNRKA